MVSKNKKICTLQKTFMKKIGMPKMYKKNEFWWGGVIYSQKKRKLYTVYIVTNKVIIVNLRNIKIHIMKK